MSFSGSNANEGILSLSKVGFRPMMRKDILFASMVLNMLSMALPMVLLQVYDRIIPNVALNTLSFLVIGMLSVLVLDVFLRTARSYLAGWLGAKFEHEMGCNALEKLFRAELKELEKDSTGVHLDRLSAIDSVRDFYSSQAGLAMVDLPFVLIFLGLLGFIGGYLLVIPIILLLVLGIIAYKLGEHLKEAIENDTLWEDRRYSFIIEVLTGIHSVKSMAMEHLMDRRYERMMESCSQASYKVIFLNNFAQGIGSSFSQITMVAVAGVGSLMVIDGSITMGALAASTLLAGRTVQPLLRALNIWTRFQHIQIANQKLSTINDLKEERPDKTRDLDKIDSIEMKNFSFRYSENTPIILQDINIKLNHGDIIGIKGGNGSGKSTLLWSMMGGHKPTEGEFLVNGEVSENFSTHSLRNRIAYLPQKPVMFRGTILDNLTMFQGDEFIDDALEVGGMLNLDTILARMPEGYETRIGDGSQNKIPSGIAQRITIARALASKPDVILFDEANSGLDNKSDEDLIRLMTRLKGKSTIILVSYRPSLLKLADKVFDLKDGRLTLQKPQEEKGKKEEKKAPAAPKKGGTGDR